MNKLRKEESHEYKTCCKHSMVDGGRLESISSGRLTPNVGAQRDRGINQPGAAGNRGGRDPGLNQPGAAGNRGRDPGINQPGAVGNRGVGGSARQTRVVDPGFNQPGRVGNRRL